MQLQLVDLAPKVAGALRAAFARHPEVSVVEGNILDVAHNTIVSPANSYGYLDGGLDRVYSEAFGLGLEKRVLATIDRVAQGLVAVGSAVLVETGHSRIPFLIVAPTMELPGPIEPAKVFFAMSALLRLTESYSRITHVFCPGLGTGVGRVEPEDAAREMESAYDKWSARRITGGPTMRCRHKRNGGRS